MSGISPSPLHSTCRRWWGWGCCTASGPAARPLHRCASRGRRAPTWPRSRPPARRGLLHSCRVQAPHPHRDPTGELHRDSLHHPSPPEQNPLCFHARDTHHTVTWRLANGHCSQLQARPHGRTGLLAVESVRDTPPVPSPHGWS